MSDYWEKRLIRLSTGGGSTSGGGSQYRNIDNKLGSGGGSGSST